MPRKIPRLLWLVLPMAFFLYFYKLDSAGLLGPDEPRYASIAREMARSGDWVTPRLWGEPWFEKSPLLYWMEAVGFRMHLGAELAPRLPVAVLSLAFLVFYWWILRREFGCLAAWLSTLILATSGAWLVCSQAGVTDLPLTATFSAAMLLALPWIARREEKYLPFVSALLAVAVLAKYLLALVLAIPLLTRFRQVRDLLRPRVVAPFLAISLPWYLLCYLRNGRPFLESFWQHQVGRFTTGQMMHPQPWWFYLPLLLVVAIPWTPLLPLLARRAPYRDPRRLFLLAWVVFVLVFFSIAAGKLPGYLLPMLPPLAALMGLAIAEAPNARFWLAACAVLLVAFPAAIPVLPATLASGLSRAPRPTMEWTWFLPIGVAVGAWLLESRGRRLAALTAIAVGATAGAVWLKIEALPQVDRIASARTIWREIAGRADQVCVDNVNRIRYTLNYYSVVPLPDCSSDPKPLWIVQPPGEPLRLAGPRTAQVPARIR